MGFWFGAGFEFRSFANPPGLDVSSTLRGISRRLLSSSAAPRNAAGMSAVLVEAPGGRAAAGRRWRQTVADMFVLRYGVGFPANFLPRMRRRGRAQARRL